MSAGLAGRWTNSQGLLQFLLLFRQERIGSNNGSYVYESNYGNGGDAPLRRPPESVLAEFGRASWEPSHYPFWDYEITTSLAYNGMKPPRDAMAAWRLAALLTMWSRYQLDQDLGQNRHTLRDWPMKKAFAHHY